jgi:Fe2+ or Zn2+ uptake regulation protein
MERNTLQRQIILNAMAKLQTHPTIDEVYVEIQKEYPSISKTTVYRNLRQLARKGSIREVSLPDGLERYDAHTHKHHHFNCKKCGGIFDIDIEYPADINSKVQEKYGFQVDDYGLVFEGICQECNKK